MQIKEIREMIRLVSQSGLSVFEMENDGFRIRMENGQPTQTTMANVAEEVVVEQNIETITHAPVVTQAPVVEGTPVKAPLVGVFYNAPSPDKPAFVKVGDRVAKGDVLCIVEAMKVMNEITAEKDGIVNQILVENEQLVEYGQELFMIG